MPDNSDEGMMQNKEAIKLLSCTPETAELNGVSSATDNLVGAKQIILCIWALFETSKINANTGAKI